jgi:hypothetical protein
MFSEDRTFKEFCRRGLHAPILSHTISILNNFPAMTIIHDGMVQDDDFSRHTQRRSHEKKDDKDRRRSPTSTETTEFLTTALEATFSSSVPWPNAADRSSRSSFNDSSSRKISHSNTTSKKDADGDIENDIPKEIVIFANEDYVDGNPYRFDATSPVVIIRKAVEIVTRMTSSSAVSEFSALIHEHKQDSIPQMPLPFSHPQRSSSSEAATAAAAAADSCDC